MTDYAKTSDIVEALRGLHLTSDRDDDFQDHLDRLLKRDCNGRSIPEPVRFGRTRETRGILVVDAPGGGKTTLVARGLAKHPGLQPREGGDTPYLISTVPSPANLKSVTSELLKQTGFDTSNSRRRVWELVDLLRGRMDLLGKRILWIDRLMIFSAPTAGVSCGS